MPASPVERALAKRLGVEVQRRRIESKLSQEQLANAVGISKNHLQLLESGLSDRKKGTPANPRLGTLIALGRELGVDVTDLLRAARSAS
ncbi:putative Xre family DNA binding protein [Gordonia araii NBRC 100433]|uniref:Putative Xre family DNA binding protein n=1 Tax=Gordonia araii NBRC 100433 TaxID=1073574 RepID=G7H148_9ACTN|nr:helix-turn-helix transcriptional regulator [Gordonia araii]NNG96705.1 helix-turn-helix transcriptional regulator [Gordonia araii NBRC 100433]GAB09609.1 putative Xre family DNA binding protein [Gordonia araii NBRC 100433]